MAHDLAWTGGRFGAYNRPMSHSRRTRVIHDGALKLEGSVTTPIFPATTYEYRGEGYHDVGYMRLSNTPNHRVVGERLAALEGTEAALVTGSGMSAISATMLSSFEPGDHLLVQDVLYGGTLSLIEFVLKKFGISVTHIDPQAPDHWARHLGLKTSWSQRNGCSPRASVLGGAERSALG